MDVIEAIFALNVYYFAVEMCKIFVSELERCFDDKSSTHSTTENDGNGFSDYGGVYKMGFAGVVGGDRK